jgi:hypothetical protein
MIPASECTVETLRLGLSAAAKVVGATPEVVHQAMADRWLPFSKNAENKRVVKIEDLLAWARRTQTGASRA